MVEQRTNTENASRGRQAFNVYMENCPTRLVLDRIADKWALLILRLLASEPRRFNRIKREIEGISQKVLSQTLKDLERDGLVSRRAFATVPVTVEYSVTDLGRTLTDVASSISRWAETNIKAVLAAQAKYDARIGV